MKKYLPLFLLSALLVYPVTYLEAGILWLVGFGNGPIAIFWIVIAIDIVLVLLAPFFYAKRRKLSFFKSLIATILPILLMITWFYIPYKISQRRSGVRREERKQFREEAQSKIGSVISLSNPKYTLIKYNETRHDLIVEVDANIPIEFDQTSLEYGVRFYFNDLKLSGLPSSPEYQNNYKVVPGCKSTFKPTILTGEKAQGKIYQPGSYKIKNGLKFWSSCTTNDIMRIIGTAVFVRDTHGELIEKFIIDKIEVTETEPQ